MAAKKVLKDKKEKKKKPSLKIVLNNVPPVFAIYKTVYIDQRFTNLIVIGFKNMSPLQFFKLYISAQHLKLIDWYIKINAKLKREKAFNDTI